MKIFVVPDSVVDCTADPHPVTFDSVSEALAAVKKVCHSKLVERVVNVSWTRVFFLDATEKDRKLAEALKDAEYAEDKIVIEDGKRRCEESFEWHGKLYQWETGTNKEKLADRRAGIAVVDWEIERILGLLRTKDDSLVEGFEIGVVWSAFGDHNCSDYIRVADERRLPKLAESCEVDFSNQDWYIGRDTYLQHCDDLGEEIGLPGAIEPDERHEEMAQEEAEAEAEPQGEKA